MVRFFYKEKESVNAKVLKVSFVHIELEFLFMLFSDVFIVGRSILEGYLLNCVLLKILTVQFLC